MFCAGCGTRLAPDSAYCHSCGGVVQEADRPPTGPGELSGSRWQPQDNPPTSISGIFPGFSSACVSYLVINGLLVVSTFLPWERLAFISASGLEVGRGWVVLIAALVAGVLAEESLRHGRAVTGLRVAQWASGVASMGMFAVELIVIASACSGEENQLFDLCVRPGLGVGAVLAGIGGLALGAAATFRHPRLQEAR